MAMSTSTSVPVRNYTERAQQHKDGSVLLSIADDRICKLNGVGALTWMVLEHNPAGIHLDKVTRELQEQFEVINSESELRYEVSSEQLQQDTARFLKNMTQMNLLETTTDSHGRELYCIRQGVSGTTSAQSLSDKLSTNSEANEPSKTPVSVSAEEDIKLRKRETFAAFIGLFAFDLLLKFGGFQSLIKKVERWPTAKPRTTDWEICRRVRAMVDQAQMYYPKKAMCLQHSAVVTCLLRRRGVPAEMILAAHEFPVRIHAWSEVEGMVVNDFQSVRTKHKVMRRL